MNYRLRLIAIVATTALFAVFLALTATGADKQEHSNATQGPIKLVLSDARGRVGMGVTLMARLVDARTSQPLVGQRIGFGCTFGNSDPIVTDENGVARYSMELAEGTECGTFQITAAFPGISTYESAWATANLTVVKGPSYLWTSDRTARAGMPANLTAKLTNGSDKPIAGANVRFKLRGQTVGTTTTDKNGFATVVVVIGPVPGSYTITATFKGDGGHEGSIARGTLHLR